MYSLYSKMLHAKITYSHAICKNAPSNIITCYEYGKCFMRYNRSLSKSDINEVLIHKS